MSDWEWRAIREDQNLQFFTGGSTLHFYFIIFFLIVNKQLYLLSYSLKGRVTDHRIGMTAHGLELFLEGEDKLHEMILALQSQHEAEALQELTSHYTAGEKHAR